MRTRLVRNVCYVEVDVGTEQVDQEWWIGRHHVRVERVGLECVEHVGIIVNLKSVMSSRLHSVRDTIVTTMGTVKDIGPVS